MKLTPCPQCGAKAYIDHPMPDGYSMGWSVGCPRYKINDGLHKNKMAFHGLSTKERAMLVWNSFVERMEGNESYSQH